MLAWLIRFEAFPEFFTHTMAGYRGLLSRDVMVEDNWMKILYKGHEIGYSNSSVEVNEDDAVQHYTVLNRMYVRLKAMGFEQPVFVDTEAYIDIMHRLQRFRFELSARDYKMHIVAYRADAKTFRGTMVTGSTRQKLSFEVPEDVVLYSPMTEMALKALAPGEKLTIKTFDPATLSPALLTIRAAVAETVDVGGEAVSATRLVSDYQGVETKSWMDGEGRLVRQDTPFGWSLEACTAEEALETIQATGYSDDIIADLSIRCRGEIKNPEGTAGLRLRLSGAPLDAGKVASRRQKVVAVTDGGIELLVRPSSWTRASATNQLPAAERRAALESTTFVQADHAEMKAQAADITAGMSGDREKALAIYSWVHEHVRKEITVSLPSALDVLHTMAGDCNEHTYLFTGLARAAGIPAKIMVGVAYNKGAFYYHAWPAVFLGRWVEMDPTWGQKTVDATHIRFTEGELNNQIEIIKLVGRIQIEVLEEL